MSYLESDVTQVVANLEQWFASVRSPGGYCGPSIGVRSQSMAYLGPGFDWRYEGLFDGYVNRHRVTQEDRYLQWMQRDLGDICRAQLPSGCFRNSSFDLNPLEGGMPHEPAMLAAACRAYRYLLEQGQAVEAPFPEVLSLWVRKHLLHRLWNRLLKTFNNWTISDFDCYQAHSVAACIEVLIEYADLNDCWLEMEHYVRAATDSIVAVQLSSGDLCGAIPLSNRPKSEISVYHAARCLPALLAAYTRCDHQPYLLAGSSLVQFLETQERPKGGFHTLVSRGSLKRQPPDLLGCSAGIVSILIRGAYAEESMIRRQTEWLLGGAMGSGAFRCAYGLGSWNRARGESNWREMVPSCGWQDKIYGFLTLAHPVKIVPAVNVPVRDEVRVGFRRALYFEDGKSMRISSIQGDHVFFSWKKGSPWAEVCLG